MHIRLIRPDEIPTIATYCCDMLDYPDQHAATVREITGLIADDVHGDFFVVEDGGEIIGTSAYVQSPMSFSIYEILWVTVAPTHRHRGIGSELVRHTLDAITSITGKDAAKLVLLSATKPPFYETLGFKKLPAPDGDNVVMIYDVATQLPA